MCSVCLYLNFQFSVCTKKTPDLNGGITDFSVWTGPEERETLGSQDLTFGVNVLRTRPLGPVSAYSGAVVRIVPHSQLSLSSHLLCRSRSCIPATANIMKYIFDDADNERDTLVPLSEIMLQYDATQAIPTSLLLHDYLAEKSLQHGTYVTLADPSATSHAPVVPMPLKAFVKMTNPTARGCVRVDVTKIFVLRADRTKDSPPELQTDRELEVEIDEGFLEGSMLVSGDTHRASRQVRVRQSIHCVSHTPVACSCSLSRARIPHHRRRTITQCT